MKGEEKSRVQVPRSSITFDHNQNIIFIMHFEYNNFYSFQNNTSTIWPKPQAQIIMSKNMKATPNTRLYYLTQIIIKKK
jgi:hypothetical protein